ncbi:DEAD-box ATP-dependent RNA helicase 46 [Citrus sinensis]|uniref:DEAD-box ATP-dependent RNA helicase 46 n=1 Tax=Citrus sinensis TaxID=2711 RepID=UPI00219CADAD|nr:DEAD-box ATP-dependent RNA helicase 46 [Citrus sinensis]KAH9742306.1 DEAD-box ATP-dependent RNA helicase 46 [Citrus sinensis]
MAMAATATATSASVRYAPEDPTLPKPWKGLVDGRTGYLYFWNPETNVTQYERPAMMAPPKSSSVPVSSSVQVQQFSQGQQHGYSPENEDDRYGGRDTNAGSKLEAVTRGNQSARGGPVQSHNIPNGTASVGVGQGGSSTRGHGSSVGGISISSEAYRRRHEVTVSGDEVPPPFMSFEATGFPPELLREVHNAGFSSPTPIQAQSWPIALQSRDIVAIAKTGSGKTLGYLLPGFIHLKRCRNDPRLGPTVLVLSPTRELATQIQDEAVKFGKSSRISCTCLYGGAPKGPQLKDIDRGVDIVVATPGRLNDILEMRRISLNQVSYLVLDEADRMLDMGFEPQIRKIVKEVPARRQTLMYTATWPREVRKIAADLLVNPVQVNIGNVDELAANKAITQHIEVLAPMEKHRRLEQILRSQEPGSKIIVFCSTKKMCDQLARNLTRPFGAAAIHGDKSQSERDYVLNQFRAGRSPVLVATDVAARGLDIKDIRVVVNYDFPTGVEDYVHRIGRTGRAGATGVAYTFFGDQDSRYASDLIKLLEGAKQQVPRELRDMASRGGGMGRPRRWAPTSSGRDGGRGGRNDSGYGGRGGRGFSGSSNRGDHDSRDRARYNDGHRGRSSSRSPDRAPSGRGRSPVRSFHQAMMERGRSSPPPQHKSPFRERSRSPLGGRRNFGNSFEDQLGLRRSSGGRDDGYGDEEEEGMIRPE